MNITEAKQALLKQVENIEPLSNEALSQMIDARRDYLTEAQINQYEDQMQPYIGQRMIHFICKKLDAAGDVNIDLLYCGEDELDATLESMKDYNINTGESDTMIIFSAPDLI